MSYALMTYRANAQHIQGVQNSHDRRLFDDIINANTSTITSNALSFKHQHKGLTLDKALHHVMFDEPKNEHMGYQYGYAYKMVVAYFGELLNTNGFEIIDFDDFNDELATAGFSALDLFTLTGAGALWEIPTPQNFPYIGYLNGAQVDTLSTQLQTVTTTNPHTWHADLQQWFDALQSGDILVGFYH